MWLFDVLSRAFRGKLSPCNDNSNVKNSVFVRQNFPGDTRAHDYFGKRGVVDVVAVGHDALTHLNKNIKLSKTTSIGAYSGKFADRAIDSVFIGDAVAQNACVKNNVIIGSNSGRYVKGRNNIILGGYMVNEGCASEDLIPSSGSEECKSDHCMRDVSNRLIVGVNDRPILIGDLVNQNLLVGGERKFFSENWVVSSNTIGFSRAKEKPSKISKDLGGVLYAHGDKFEYCHSNGIVYTLVDPEKMLSMDNVSCDKVQFLIQNAQGTSLISVSIVPTNAEADNIVNLSIAVTSDVPNKTVSFMRKPTTPSADLDNKWRVSFDVLSTQNILASFEPRFSSFDGQRIRFYVKASILGVHSFVAS